MAAGNGGLARKRCPKCGPDQLPQSPEEEEKQPLSLIMALQKTSSAESSRLWGKKCLCKGNFCLTWGQAQESNRKGTGRENLGMKWKKRACYTPGSKEPHLHGCHCTSSQILIKWNNPSVTNLHLPNVEVQCFSNINLQVIPVCKSLQAHQEKKPSETDSGWSLSPSSCSRWCHRWQFRALIPAALPRSPHCFLDSQLTLFLGPQTDPFLGLHQSESHPSAYPSHPDVGEKAFWFN